MVKLILLVGNIGTGKSTYVEKKLKELYDAFVICPDDYKETDSASKDERLKKEINENLSKGINVIVDGCNVSKNARGYFAYMAKKNNAFLIAYNFGKGNANSLCRRLEEDRGIEQDIWVNSHRSNEKEFEAPSYKEGFNEIHINKPTNDVPINFILQSQDNN